MREEDFTPPYFYCGLYDYEQLMSRPLQDCHVHEWRTLESTKVGREVQWRLGLMSPERQMAGLANIANASAAGMMAARYSEQIAAQRQGQSFGAGLASAYMPQGFTGLFPWRR